MSAAEFLRCKFLTFLSDHEFFTNSSLTLECIVELLLLCVLLLESSTLNCVVDVAPFAECTCKQHVKLTGVLAGIA